jgi:hypothetical protein
MSWLKITNQGCIELGALTLLGASTKEGIEGKIGFFGSGAKYGLAVLLREGIDFKIYSGLERIAVDTEDVQLGEQTFQRILIAGQTTSFTTRMGPTWEVWFAIREFICNAIDEGGDSVKVLDALESPMPNETSIFIDCEDSRVHHFVEHLDDYISQQEPIFSAKGNFGKVDMLPMPENCTDAIVYRRKVRVVPENFGEDALWRYNFEDIEINESRIFVHTYQYLERIAQVLTLCDDREIVSRFLKSFSSDFDCLEHEAYWQYVGENFTAVWPELLGTKRIYKEGQSKFYSIEDTLGQWVLPTNLVCKLADQFPQLNIVGRDGTNFLEVEDAAFGIRVEDALSLLKGIGYQLTVNYKIGNFLDSDVMGRYSRVTNMVYVSIAKHPPQKDDLELQSTLLEEIYHVQGMRDGSREFEQALLKELITAKQDAAKLQAIRSLLR